MANGGAEEVTVRKGLLCRVGLHQWFMDSAWFTHADKCGRCGQWRDPAEGAEVDAERDAWVSGRTDEPWRESLGRVAAVMADRRLRG